MISWVSRGSLFFLSFYMPWIDSAFPWLARGWITDGTGMWSPAAQAGISLPGGSVLAQLSVQGYTSPAGSCSSLPRDEWMGWLLLPRTTISFLMDRKVALNECTYEILCVSIILASIPLLHASATHVNPLPVLQSSLPHAGDSEKGLNCNLVFVFPWKNEWFATRMSLGNCITKPCCGMVVPGKGKLLACGSARCSFQKKEILVVFLFLLPAAEKGSWKKWKKRSETLPASTRGRICYTLG